MESRGPAEQTTRGQILPSFNAAALGADLAAKLSARSSLALKNVRRQVEKATGTGTTANCEGWGSGKALHFIREWYQDVGGDEVKICDQYFGARRTGTCSACCKSVRPNVRIWDSYQIGGIWNRSKRPWKRRFKDIGSFESPSRIHLTRRSWRSS